MKQKKVNGILANNLKYYRNKAGYTQAVVAEKAKMSSRQYQKLEGGLANPNLDTINSVARVFEVTLDQLLRVSFFRTELSPDDFLEAYKVKFSDEKIGAGIRDSFGLILWGNLYAEKLQGGERNYSKEPLNLLRVLKGSSLETMRNQLMCEQKGLISPYLNHHLDKTNGKLIFFHYYPTLILPEKGDEPYYVSLYISTIESDSQRNYYNYCKLLMTLA